MRLAIIDLGTNSVRFDVHQISRSGVRERLYREKLMLRLGQGVFLRGELDAEAAERTLAAFKAFRSTCNELRVSKIVAFATSALREAQDAEELIRLIETKTGIRVQVISGLDEAKLIAQGFLANEKKKLKTRFGLIDIGGGSTEVSICRDRTVLHSMSFDLGTARIQQLFFKEGLPAAALPAAIKELKTYIQETVRPTIEDEHWPKVNLFYGSSGTARAVARLIHKQNPESAGVGLSFSLADLRKLNRKMAPLSTSQLLALPGMEAKRVDMILSGSLLLEEMMTLLGAKRLITTEHSLRDGILSEELKLMTPGRTDDQQALSRKARICSLCKSFGVRETQTTPLLTLTQDLFHGLKGHHHLSDKWLFYLEAVGMFYDTGKSINLVQHEKHSVYILKNADFGVYEKWEIQLLADLCRHLSSRKMPPRFSAKNAQARKVYSILLGILRIAKALNHDAKRMLRIAEIKNERAAVLIRLAGRSNYEIEKLKFDQRKALLELAIDKPLRIA